MNKKDLYLNSCDIDAAHNILQEQIAKYASEHSELWMITIKNLLNNEPSIECRTLMALAILLVERRTEK